MTRKSTGKFNYLLALLVFGLTMLLMYLAAGVLTFGISLAAVLLQGMNGAGRVYSYLMDNMNLYSVLVYLIVLSVFGLWYYFAFVQKTGMKSYARGSVAQFSPLSFVWMLLLAFAAQHATSLIMMLVAALAPNVMNEYTQMIEVSGMNNYSLLWFVGTLILPPVTEEIIFRGLILGYLRRAGAGFILANLIQAVCFGIYHQNLVQGIYAVVMGFLLGYLADRYESLLAPMFLHFLFNLFGTVLVELESAFIPQYGQVMLILQSIPLLVASLLLIQLRVGEKGKKVQEEKRP